MRTIKNRSVVRPTQQFLRLIWILNWQARCLNNFMIVAQLEYHWINFRLYVLQFSKIKHPYVP